MLPSVLAEQLQDGLKDYIDTTFPITNPVFKDSLSKMLRTPDAVFHEPYVAVRLPFRTYEGDTDIFKSINLPYAPYVHQYKAWERLNGEDGKSTLVSDVQPINAHVDIVVIPSARGGISTNFMQSAKQRLPISVRPLLSDFVTLTRLEHLLKVKLPKLVICGGKTMLSKFEQSSNS